MPEALLFKDQLESVKRTGTEAAASIADLLDSLHQQLALCPANSKGYLRLWAFCHGRELSSALRGTLGPNVAILTNDMADFLHLSAVLKPYRDWSLIVPPLKYPENVFEIIPFAGKMLIPADGIAFLGFKKAGTGALTELSENSAASEFSEKVHASPEIRAGIAISGLSTGGAIARYYYVSLESQAEQFGGATGGAQGESLALPPAAHELLQGRDVEELKANRLSFIYYNRGLADEAERFWYDLAILHPFRCFPVYLGALPQSPSVRVVASCPVTMPVLAEESAEKHRRTLRNVRKALLEVLAANESTAGGKLFDLAAVTEDFSDEVGGESRIRLVFYVLGFDYEGTTRTHAAIVLK